MSLVLAARYASKGNLTQFTQIVQKEKDYYLSDPWVPYSALTIALVFLPEALDSYYELLIHQLCKGEVEEATSEVPEETLKLPEAEMDTRRHVLVEYLSSRATELGWVQEKEDDDPYSKWIQIRTRKVDDCCGMIQQFRYTPDKLMPWQEGIANVVSLYRQYYSEWFTISEFEKNDCKTNVFKLLGNSAANVISRDMRKLVVPYLNYIDDWSGLYAWIEENSNNLELLLPMASNKAISSAIIAACYLCKNTDQASISTLKSIQKAIPVSSQYPKNDLNYNSYASTDFSSLTNLLQSSITARSEKALSFLGDLIKAMSLLSVQFNVTLREVAYLRLVATAEEQYNVVPDYLRNCNDFHKAHEVLHWLKECHILEKVSISQIDSALIESSLSQGDFGFIHKYYPRPPLDIIIKTFDYFYDNATNGNKTRSKMKSAATCLDLATEPSEELERRKALLHATHELSQFSLTLTPGVPLKPIEIKQHASDPLYIIHRVLELNPEACKEISLLTVIAEDLLKFTGDSSLLNHPVDTVPVRVCAMCVQAALVDTNFTLAYEYALSLSALKESSVAWTACFQVGKFISPDWESARPPKSVLNKQMDILSRTLTICPRENIASVLSAWKRNEQLLEPTPHDTQDNDKYHEPQGPSGDATTAHGDRKRDQISNLLVSGLGWAIGAK
ncbi:hypothetical protein TRICI_006226 [Trichomonascus ciferrii]|uniref:Sec39 domain-containing protein n=1 Tax=Trichomonascus ciferrii TaxID=44093 RepID=A0A642UJL8_9ASCO|nr:hypothetical protein TRICI_006226 [Trichomonascus ciferrii]